MMGDDHQSEPEHGFSNIQDAETIPLDRRRTRYAVQGQGLAFKYGSKSLSAALKGVDINVEKGAIYGLLGPSGCGKTTLLRCIVGRLKPKGGVIKIYGRNPGDPTNCIPGKGVGYMPQELALYPEITIEETLIYFGCLYLMDIRYLTERIHFLLKFLEIPDKSKLVKNLSGGEKRRVSFAAALVHEPPLLILDEPTVGVDPLLRHSIWDHLKHLTKTNHMTIIITTHYVEEARKANMVGLMRDGHLLAEMNPEILIQKHGVQNLEEVFFKLCRKETKSLQQSSADATAASNDISVSDRVWLTQEEMQRVQKEDDISVGDYKGSNLNSEVDLFQEEDPEPDVNFKRPTPFRRLKESQMRMATLIAKSFVCLKRNTWFAIFQIFIPAIQVIVFCLAIGHDPFDIPIAVVNNETNYFGSSQLFLSTLSNRTFKQEIFHTLPSALESVHAGKSKAALYIGPRFSAALSDRLMEGNNVENQTIEDSGIRLHLDMTNQQIALTVYTEILKDFQIFAKKMLVENYQNPRLADSPIVLEPPVYGKLEPNFNEFMAPGIVLAITYILSVGLTSLSIIIERKEGLLERSWVAGVCAGEVIFSIIFILFATMMAQIALVSVFVFLVFSLPIHGSIFWTIVCIILAGTNGIAYGLLISAVCTDEVVAMLVALGSFFPNLLTSGILWPVEGMPYYLRYISYSLPLTLLSDTLRSLMSRGWSIAEYNNWIGILIPIGWTIFLILLSTLIFKLRST